MLVLLHPTYLEIHIYTMPMGLAAKIISEILHMPVAMAPHMPIAMATQVTIFEILLSTYRRCVILARLFLLFFFVSRLLQRKKLDIT